MPSPRRLPYSARRVLPTLPHPMPTDELRTADPVTGEHPIVVPPEPSGPAPLPPGGGFAAALGPDYGTDPEGDARRRAEQGVVDLGDGTLVAGVPPEQLDEVARELTRAPSAELLRAQVSDPTGLAALAASRLATPEPVIGRAGIEGHEPEHGEHNGIGWVRCSCGTWDAMVTGPSSAAWARRDYDRHLAESRA